VTKVDAVVCWCGARAVKTKDVEFRRQAVWTAQEGEDEKQPVAETVEKITASILKSQNMRKATLHTLLGSIQSCVLVIMRGRKRDDGDSLRGNNGPCFGLRLPPRGTQGHALDKRARGGSNEALWKRDDRSAPAPGAHRLHEAAEGALGPRLDSRHFWACCRGFFSLCSRTVDLARWQVPRKHVLVHARLGCANLQAWRERLGAA
jgi:hypothetical protein